MLTTSVAGRTWNFSHAIGRNAAAGNGFTQPTALALSPSGFIYVASRGNEVRAGDSVSPNKRIGKVTFNQEFVLELARQEYTWVAGLAVAADENLYVSEEFENYIAIYSPDGERIGQWGETGSEEGQLDGPSGMAFDKADDLYVVDSRNDRVQKFTKDGRFLMGWGTSGDGHGQLSRPWGITIDKNGDVYVADWGNNRVEKFSPDGTFLRSFGASDGDSGNLNHPADVGVDSEGDVYVTDWGNKRVQIFDPDGSIITALRGDAHEFSDWAKDVVEASPDVVKAYRRVKDLTPLGWFDRPVGIAVDDQDRIVVADSSRGRIQVYAKEKNYLEAQFNL